MITSSDSLFWKELLLNRAQEPGDSRTGNLETDGAVLVLEYSRDREALAVPQLDDGGDSRGGQRPEP